MGRISAGRSGPGVLLAAALFLLPLVAMVAGSLREPGLPPPLGAELLPGAPVLSAYERAFAVAPLGRGHRTAFEFLRFGEAAAVSAVMLALSAALTALALLAVRWVRAGADA